MTQLSSYIRRLKAQNSRGFAGILAVDLQNVDPNEGNPNVPEVPFHV